MVNGGIAIVFDSTPQFKAMLDDTLPKNLEGEVVEGTFAIFTSRDKKIISSTNEHLKIDSYLNLEDSFFTIKNGNQFSKIVEIANSYYAVGVRCSSGYREYKSRVDDYQNDVLSFVFIKIGNKKENKIVKKQNKLLTNLHKKKTETSVELATFYIGNKFLAVDSKNVVEAIAIEELKESIEMNKENHFKGMVLHKDRLIAVLDIRDFINEEITNEELTNIILFQYDKDNIEHCVGILVSSLEHISLVEQKSIQYIQNHFLGSGTLVQSLVDINDYEVSQVAMLLDIKKIDENLTKKI